MCGKKFELGFWALSFGFASDGCVCVCVICNAAGKVWKEGEGILSCFSGCFAPGGGLRRKRRRGLVEIYRWRWMKERIKRSKITGVGGSTEHGVQYNK